MNQAALAKSVKIVNVRSIMTIKITDICRYPVKGLAADHMTAVSLTAGGPLPYDRKWAIAHSASKIDTSNIKWVPKQNFLMLARDQKLAKLGAEFNEATSEMIITRKGKPISRGKLNDHMGRTLLQTFLSGFVQGTGRSNPKIVESQKDGAFTDQSENLVSLINVASVKDIERVARLPVDPMRFRGNIYFEGAPAWKERSWVGKKLKIGDVVLEIVEEIERCTATSINLATGEEDINMPLTLRRGFGHIICGVFAKIITDGVINNDDEISILE